MGGGRWEWGDYGEVAIKGTFGDRVYDFYRKLDCGRLPAGVSAMNPYKNARARAYTRAFLSSYFADNNPRVLVLGINPGRFGAGVTGVSFTDPVVLADVCGIQNHLPRRRELSSVFVYDFIERMGGPAAFYSRYFITSLSPLGFVRAGKNLNYYDVPALARAVEPFIRASIERQLELGGRRDHAIVLGMGTNYKFLQRLNRERGYFGSISPLEHPRFIMQYRRKRVNGYLNKYQRVFEQAARTI